MDFPNSEIATLTDKNRPNMGHSRPNFSPKIESIHSTSVKGPSGIRALWIAPFYYIYFTPNTAIWFQKFGSTCSQIQSIYHIPGRNVTQSR